MIAGAQCTVANRSSDPARPGISRACDPCDRKPYRGRRGMYSPLRDLSSQTGDLPSFSASSPRGHDLTVAAVRRAAILGGLPQCFRHSEVLRHELRLLPPGYAPRLRQPLPSPLSTAALVRLSLNATVAEPQLSTTPPWLSGALFARPNDRTTRACPSSFTPARLTAPTQSAACIRGNPFLLLGYSVSWAKRSPSRRTPHPQPPTTELPATCLPTPPAILRAVYDLRREPARLAPRLSRRLSNGSSAARGRQPSSASLRAPTTDRPLARGLARGIITAGRHHFQGVAFLRRKLGLNATI